MASKLPPCEGAAQRADGHSAYVFCNRLIEDQEMMTIKLPNNIDYFQICDLNLDSEKNRIKFVLVDPLEPEQYQQFILKNIIFIELFSDLGFFENNYVLGHFRFSYIKNQDLKKFDINIDNIFTTTRPKQEPYAPDQFLLLDIDGDLTLKAIGEDYSLNHLDH